MLLSAAPSLPPSCFPLGFLILDHISHTFVGLQLGYVRYLDALDARGIYSKIRHPNSEEVPRAEIEAGMTIGRLVRQAENGSCPPSYTIVPRPSTFKQVSTEAEASVRVADI